MIELYIFSIFVTELKYYVVYLYENDFSYNLFSDVELQNDLSNGNSNYCTRINLRSDLPPKFVTYTLFKIFKCERNLNIIVCACDD